MNLKDILINNQNKIEIKVTPNANADKIIISDEGGIYQIKAYITVTPENGKANNQLIKLLAKELRIPKSKICIIKGLKSRNKTIVIEA